MPVRSVERKLTAILAADVVGYSGLMGADEVGTLHRLTACRAIVDGLIATHRGRVFNTAGDSVVADFASVVEAVECAVAMQEALAGDNVNQPAAKQMQFRVGVHVGDVIVQGNNLLGDGVNIAARLEGIAEPGGICISEDAFRQVRGKIETEFLNAGEQRLKNIAQPVRVYRTRSASDAEFPASATVSALALPDKPSIAVLPFANMSSDPDQEFFAEGIAEDVITALSRYPSLFVIARNSSFTYKGRAIQVRQVGRELGVRYVLDGSLRRSGNRIRVTAQLAEAETGSHVWAERYDRNLADIFAVQDEITEAVTTAIAPAIAQAEQQRAMRKPPDNLDAWAAYQRGLWHLYRWTPEETLVAQEFFQRAIVSDPSFAGGYRGLAIAKFNGAANFQLEDLDESLNAAERLSADAIARDPNDAEARAQLSDVYMRRGHSTMALTEAKRALAINPNLAFAHRALGVALVFSGKPADGIAALETFLRLEPRSPASASPLNGITLGLYFSGEYAASVDAARRAIESYPGYTLPYRWLAAALGQLGRTVEAKQALDTAIAVAPASFDMYVRKRVPWMRPEDHAHMLEGLRKAGWEG